MGHGYSKVLSVFGEAGVLSPFFIGASPWQMIGNYRISDDGLNYGIVALTQFLQKSSNIAAVKILLSLGRNWEILLLSALQLHGELQLK